MNQKWFTNNFLIIGLITLALIGGILYFALTRQSLNKVQQSPPPPVGENSLTNNVAGWKTYRSEKYGFEIQYPADWKISENDEFVGFRSPEWDKEPKLEGSTVTVSISRGITKEEAWLNSGFETKEEAVREKDEPLGGFGSEKYLARGSSAGPATPARETTINGFPAIVAEAPTRLYTAEGYAGAAGGKQIFIMGNNIYANVRVEASLYEIFDQMVSTFKFTR